MTQEQREVILRRLSEASEMDVELGHVKADEALVEALELLGETQIVEAFQDIRKWYA